MKERLAKLSGGVAVIKAFGKIAKIFFPHGMDGWMTLFWSKQTNKQNKIKQPNKTEQNQTKINTSKQPNTTKQN